MRDFFGMLGGAGRLIGIGTGVLALALFANGARADAVYTIQQGNPKISPYAGPYVSVDVHLIDSTDAKVTFTSLSDSQYTYLMGGAQSADVNVNAAHFTASNFSLTNVYSGYSTPSETGYNSQNVSTFGNFNLSMDSFDGWSHTSSTISFTIANTSGTWSSAANVLTPNGDGDFVASHIFVAANPPNQSNGAVATGYAADVDQPNIVTVPLPAPVYAGMALLGMMGLMLKLGRRSLAC